MLKPIPLLYPQFQRGVPHTIQKWRKSYALLIKTSSNPDMVEYVWVDETICSLHSTTWQQKTILDRLWQGNQHHTGNLSTCLRNAHECRLEFRPISDDWLYECIFIRVPDAAVFYNIGHLPVFKPGEKRIEVIQFLKIPEYTLPNVHLGHSPDQFTSRFFWIYHLQPSITRLYLVDFWPQENRTVLVFAYPFFCGDALCNP